MSKSSSGARAKKRTRPACCAMPASTWTSTASIRSAFNTRTPTTRFVSPTSSCRPLSKTPTGTSPLSPMAGSSRPCAPAICGVRSPLRHGSAPIQDCSSTPPSTSGTPHMQPVALMVRTHAANTCTSTTRRATWPRSTCSSTSTKKATSISMPTSTPLRQCSPPKRFSSAAPTTQRHLSARPAVSSVSSESAMPTSAHC